MTKGGGLMVCGTTSDAGKSTVVAGLCRALARGGMRVAPFKAQNMANNSWVTAAGEEIGRSTAAQAWAAGVEPEAAMNPILLKPAGERTSQLVVRGRPWGMVEAAGIRDRHHRLWPVVTAALDDLRGRFDAVICEGAGSPAEINLLDADLVNLSLAVEAGLPALVVGDIERGGVFASLYGTVALLPDAQRACVAGFVINKFRGDPGLLGSGPAELERRCGVPTLGVLPWVDGVALDGEDSLNIGTGPENQLPGAALDIAVIRFPRLANATDIDPLAAEPGVHVRYVSSVAALGQPDLVVLPGTKATVADLAWLHREGLDAALSAATTVLGICGGYQMLGRRIVDGVEHPTPATVAGLGLLDTETIFEPGKTTVQRRGAALGQPLSGYEIHHGRTPPSQPWLALHGGDEGSSADGWVFGTSLHGLFESDSFRAAFLQLVARRAGKAWAPAGVRYGDLRARRADRLADLVAAHLDLGALERLIERSRR